MQGNAASITVNRKTIVTSVIILIALAIATPAFDIGVDARRINEIVLGKRAVTADIALRHSRVFGNSPQFWLGLQTQYDLDVTEDRLGTRLDREVRPLAMA